jgi:hypothetical protein
MLEIFICSDTKALFLQELKSGNISEDAIVFIKDTKEIYTHGTYYAAGGGGEMPNLAKVATSGDYNDLENKPNIPSLDDYATKQYVEQQIGGINEILISIING